ncbi:hypothetical protein EJ08DRAFT_738747 [Tothia fuscella]|uniref:Nephrocystin 3-like N-terminal domain-containing protein n=1 Tax=Tothia fuscella TaxID=1048955 RepID=A0A9P4NGC5_9PEZI|nr:hypothetical protein EJ08DRAFT_738747 [Tothia fuscella]
MDPYSALSVASAIVTLVDATAKLISTAHEIYSKGHLEDLQVLKQTTANMHTLCEKCLQREHSRESDEWAQVRPLAVQCRNISQEITRLVNKTEYMEKGHFRFSAKAAWEAFWTKDKILELQKKLNECSVQLQLQVHSAKVLTYRCHSRMPEILSRQCWNLAKKSPIKMLYSRLSDSKAWAPDGFVIPYVETPKPAFAEWLESGSGIFHVFGKPGAGKSTLMKFIIDHRETEKRLVAWADNKQFIIASGYFWKLGLHSHTNLAGLHRTLLYAILKACPDAIQILFPQHWNPPVYQMWTSHGRIDFSADAIEKAFEDVIQNGDLKQTHKLCFFIDGLDEYDEPFKTYWHLTQRIKRWVDVSSGTLKVCVSSRELPPFDTLKAARRIRLQDLTSCDIDKAVQKELEGHEYFQRLNQTHPTECAELVQEITGKACGVFIWVMLTLKHLKERSAYQDSIFDLLRRIDDIPEELDSFFSYILGSIRNTERAQAFRILAFAKCARIQGNDHNRFYNPVDLSLLRCSFIEDYAKNKDFAKRLAAQEMDSDQTRIREERTAAQINELCPIQVVFAHRLIPEFLEQHLQSYQNQYLRDFDVIDALIQLYVAVMKIMPFEDSYNFVRLDHHFYFLLSMLRQRSDQSFYFPALHGLERAVHEEQLSWSPEFVVYKWLKFKDPPFHKLPLEFDRRAVYVSVTHFTIQLEFYEYVLWKLAEIPADFDPCTATELTWTLLYDCVYNEEPNIGHIRKIWKKCLNQDFVPAPDGVEEIGFSVWKTWLQRIFILPRKHKQMK